MSLYDYRASQQFAAANPPFYALIMAAIRNADTQKAARLGMSFPEVHAEFEAHYNAPGGMLAGERNDDAGAMHHASME